MFNFCFSLRGALEDAGIKPKQWIAAYFGKKKDNFHLDFCTRSTEEIWQAIENYSLDTPVGINRSLQHMWKELVDFFRAASLKIDNDGLESAMATILGLPVDIDGKAKEDLEGLDGGARGEPKDDKKMGDQQRGPEKEEPIMVQATDDGCVLHPTTLGTSPAVGLGPGDQDGTGGTTAVGHAAEGMFTDSHKEGRQKKKNKLTAIIRCTWN